MIISNQTRIEAAFGDLEQRGIIARAHYWCCNGCASSGIYNNELPRYRERFGSEDQPIGYVFFHEQATESANNGGPLLLSHGSISEGDDFTPAEQVRHDQQLVAQIVIEELREHGFEVQWSGDLDCKIVVVQPYDGWNLDYGDTDDRDDDYEDDEDE